MNTEDHSNLCFKPGYLKDFLQSSLSRGIGEIGKLGIEHKILGMQIGMQNSVSKECYEKNGQTVAGKNWEETSLLMAALVLCQYHDKAIVRTTLTDCSSP